MYKADLHLHTKVSDGSEDIEEILDMAKYMGITHLSITNHDTTQRTEEYIEKAKKQGIQAIPELRCRRMIRKPECAPIF